LDKYVRLSDYKDKYPDVFKQRMASFGCGEGWRGLVDRLVQKAFDENFCILQVKEKFGLLRIYVTLYTEELSAFIQDLENESSKICEECGSTDGVTTMGDWLKTYCKKCRNS